MCSSKNCKLFALAVPIALWERVGVLGSPNSVTIIQEREGSQAGKVLAAFPTPEAAVKNFPFNDQVFRMVTIAVGKGVDDPVNPMDLGFIESDKEKYSPTHVWTIRQKTENGTDYVVGVWGSQKAAEDWCSYAGPGDFYVQRMEIQGTDHPDYGTPEDEVCHCGMLMSQHDAASACTNPIPMSMPKLQAPTEWPGEKVFLEKAMEHIETSAKWDQDDDQEFGEEERAANSRQELRDALGMVIQYMKTAKNDEAR